MAVNIVSIRLATIFGTFNREKLITVAGKDRKTKYGKLLTLSNAKAAPKIEIKIFFKINWRFIKAINMDKAIKPKDNLTNRKLGFLKFILSKRNIVWFSTIE